MYLCIARVRKIDSRAFRGKFAKRNFPESGAAGGDRTHDPWLRRPILYPLSYSRTGMPIRREG